MPPLSVHILSYGRTLCGSLHGLPRDWGPGLRWIGITDDWTSHATCAECRRCAALLELGADVERIQHDLAARRRYPLGITPCATSPKP